MLIFKKSSNLVRKFMLILQFLSTKFIIKICLYVLSKDRFVLVEDADKIFHDLFVIFLLPANL